MIIHPAVIVHGLADANAALAPGLPVTLLSASGAALFAGCAWWAAIVAAARAGNPQTEAMDILDCADASGTAMGALRTGVHRLILWPEAPGWDAVAAVAGQAGGFILPEPPPALDLSQHNAIRRLHTWLQDRERP
ncbi:MAG TPA: hypothetical protein VGF36_10010 [Rhodopila sp.]|jgi:hypothetical protein